MDIQFSSLKETTLYNKALEGDNEALTQLGIIASKNGQKGFSKLFFNFATPSLYKGEFLSEIWGLTTLTADIYKLILAFLLVYKTQIKKKVLMLLASSPT